MCVCVCVCVLPTLCCQHGLIKVQSESTEKLEHANTGRASTGHERCLRFTASEEREDRVSHQQDGHGSSFTGARCIKLDLVFYFSLILSQTYIRMLHDACLRVTEGWLRWPVLLCIMGKIRHIYEEKNMADATALLSRGSGRLLHFKIAENFCLLEEYHAKKVLFNSFNQLNGNVSGIWSDGFSRKPKSLH